MASKQYITVIQHLGEAVGRIIGLLDENSMVVASSDLSLMNTTRVGLPMDMAVDDVLRHGGYTYRYVDKNRNVFKMVFSSKAPGQLRARFEKLLEGLLKDGPGFLFNNVLSTHSRPFLTKVESGLTARSQTTTLNIFLTIALKIPHCKPFLKQISGFLSLFRRVSPA